MARSMPATAPKTHHMARRSRHARKTREGLAVAIISWIETTYHRRYRQRGLVRITPIEFEYSLRSQQSVIQPLQPDPPNNQSTNAWADPLGVLLVGASGALIETVGNSSIM